MDFKPEDILIHLGVNELNLEGELGTCASFYYRYASLATDAEQEYEHAVLKLEQYEADLAKKIISQLLADGLKREKITESEIKRRYRYDERWKALKDEVLTAQSNFKKLDKAAKAFEMKNQSCMSINKRQLFKASKGMLNVDDL